MLDKEKVRPDKEGTEGITWVLAHESVHAVGLDLELSRGLPAGPPSKYEEEIACQFQHSVGQEIDYNPGYHEWYYCGFSYLWSDKYMRSANNVVRKSLGIDLSLPPGNFYSELSLQLYNAFRYTEYKPLRHFPPPEYLDVKADLLDIFIY